MAKGYLFRGKPVSFEEAFLDIEEIKIEGTEGDVMQGNKILLNKNNWGFLVVILFVKIKDIAYH